MLARTQPGFFAEQTSQLRLAIVGVQTALDGIRPVQGMLDADVAHALGTFPATQGFQQLQIDSNDSGHISPGRHAHIVWELTEVSRRLYSALAASEPDIAFNIGEVELIDGTVLKVVKSDLVRDA